MTASMPRDTFINATKQIAEEGTVTGQVLALAARFAGRAAASPESFRKGVTAPMIWNSQHGTFHDGTEQEVDEAIDVLISLLPNSTSTPNS